MDPFEMKADFLRRNLEALAILLEYGDGRCIIVILG
jgi:hypothetical protein